MDEKFDEDDGERERERGRGRVVGLGEERREKYFVKGKKWDNIGVLIGIENLLLNHPPKKIQPRTPPSPKKKKKNLILPL